MDGLVLEMIRTIYTSVHAIIGQVERGEHHDAVSVEFLLDVACQLVDALYQIGFLAFQKHHGFAMRESLAKSSLLDERLNEGTVILVLAGVFQRFLYLGMADEFFRYS